VTPARTFEAEAPLAAFALAPSGAEMAAVLKNGKTQVWSVAGKPLRSWASGDRPVGGLFYAGDRRVVAVAGGSVLVFDASSGQKLAAWQAHKEDIESVAASGDGSLFATASDDGSVKLWKADGLLLRTLTGGLGEMIGVALSPAGDRVAGAGSDTNIRLFDAKTAAVEHVLDLPMSCLALAFSPDGRALAAGSVDGTVTLWDAASGAAKGTLGRYPVPVGAVRFSADGKRLASTGLSINPSTAETEAKVWDLATKKETATPIGLSAWNAVGFAPDGRSIVVGIHERAISVWELSS
jgi:WD40 repeat protein